MKPKVMYLILFTVAMLLCACGYKSSDKNAPIETGTADMVVVEENPGLSHFSDTLSDGKYHQMILEAIANGDKQTFAKMVSYPLSRPYPLPDIETEGQMVRYFDTLFDKQFRQRIAKLDSNVDISTDHNPETEPSFRVAIFKKGTKASEVPAIVLLGERTIEGSMHLETLNFKSDKYTVVIVPEDVVDGKSYCSIYDRAGREVARNISCKKCMQPFQ